MSAPNSVPNIEVIGRRNSANVQKVMWTLGELGLGYQRIDAAGSFGLPQDYALLNPNPVVPTIRDGDLVLWESNACVRHLSRTYANNSQATPNLCPQDVRSLALADQWMEWSRSDYSQHFFQVFLNKIRLPEGKARPELVEPAVAALGKVYGQLDQHLGKHAYVGGAQFSMGDIPVGTFSYRYMEMDIERPALPNVERWYQTLTERAAYAKHVMIPFGRNSAEWDAAEQANAEVQ